MSETCLPLYRIIPRVPQCLPLYRLIPRVPQCLPLYRLIPRVPQCLSLYRLIPRVPQCLSLYYKIPPWVTRIIILSLWYYRFGWTAKAVNNAMYNLLYISSVVILIKTNDNFSAKKCNYRAHGPCRELKRVMTHASTPKPHSGITSWLQPGVSKRCDF